jgi:hypothetical protein
MTLTCDRCQQQTAGLIVVHATNHMILQHDPDWLVTQVAEPNVVELVSKVWCPTCKETLS